LGFNWQLLISGGKKLHPQMRLKGVLMQIFEKNFLGVREKKILERVNVDTLEGKNLLLWTH